eukprot:11172618-Lingulodinium_polyedra.AAC.1
MARRRRMPTIVCVDLLANICVAWPTVLAHAILFEGCVLSRRNLWATTLPSTMGPPRGHSKSY